MGYPQRWASGALALLVWGALGGCRADPGARLVDEPSPPPQSEAAQKVRYLEALVRRRPEHWRARVRLANLYTASERDREAFEALRAAAETARRNVGLHAALAEAAEGIDYADWELYAWGEVIRRSPGDWNARLRLAQFYRRLGWHADAARQLDLAAALAPNSSAVLRERATLFAVTGPQPKARELARQLSRRFPRLPYGYSLLGDLAASAGRWRDAVEFGRQAMLRAPDDPSFRVRLAEYHLYRTDTPSPETGLQLLNETLRKSPEHAQARYLRGVALRRMGRNAEALNDLQQAYRQNAEQAGAALHLAELLRAGGKSGQAERLLADYSRREARLQSFQQAAARLSAKPLSPEAHLEMARSHMQQGRYGAALVEFLTTSRLDSGNQVAREGLRSALQQQGRAPASLAPLEQRPGSPPAPA